MADPTIKGTDLYEEIAPIVEEETTDGQTFLTKIAAKISAYIVANDFVTGNYIGYIYTTTPPTPSTLVVAMAKLIPESVSFATPVPYDYVSWLKNTFTYQPPATALKALTINWVLTSLPPHTFVSGPIPFNPLMDTLEVLGDLSDIRTAEGFWAMISDVIVWSVLTSLTRMPISTVNAIGTDTSSGIITWIPVDLPDFKQNFICEIFYNATNKRLVAWLEEREIDTSHLSGKVDVQLPPKLYRDALKDWKELKDITMDCKFYKLQDNGRKILLMTGAQA